MFQRIKIWKFTVRKIHQIYSHHPQFSAIFNSEVIIFAKDYGGILYP